MRVRMRQEARGSLSSNPGLMEEFWRVELGLKGMVNPLGSSG